MQLCAALAAALLGATEGRLGPVIRSPPAYFAGSASPVSPGAWIPHPFYGGAPVFEATAPGLVLGVHAHLSDVRPPSRLAPLSSLRCVVDGRAVFEATLDADLGAVCDVSFLSHGGMHSIAAYALHNDSCGATLLGTPTFFRASGDIVPAQPEAAARLTASEAILRAATPAGTAALVG